MNILTQSIAMRLILAAIIVQCSTILVAIMVFPLLAPFTTYRAMADNSVRGYVISSLEREPDGTFSIRPNNALIKYAALRPNLKFAVRLPDGRYARGSFPELTSILTQIGVLVPRRDDTLETVFPGRPDDAVFVTTQTTPMGHLVVATSGDEFKTEDIPGFFWSFLPAVLPAYGPVVLGVIFGIPFVIRRIMRPIADAARAASLIDVRSLDQRLPLEGIPSEFAPLVLAINSALDRLSEGWTNQRVFTANAAHELRTPVAVLQARVETLPNDVPLRTALTRDVYRLSVLIDQLLSVARLERRDIALEPVNLVMLVRDLVADWAPVAIRSGVTIGLNTDGTAIWVLGDARAIEGAIAALIDNAIKTEPSGETVEVKVRAGAYITVIDHGAGVEIADRSAVFEPFWRKDERRAGSGLGLATVQETARLHSGNVRVHGQPGDGASFELFIPEVNHAVSTEGKSTSPLPVDS